MGKASLENYNSSVIRADPRRELNQRPPLRIIGLSPERFMPFLAMRSYEVEQKVFCPQQLSSLRANDTTPMRYSDVK
jgi:hypothetical protein